ncbi:MAG: hypothetical protein MAG715_00635 [Methanonatronarchaeales archaeon]|nr:hypothetical protein [Methanonatronarchaeales archaeon]
MNRYFSRRRITKEDMPSTTRFQIKGGEGELHTLIASERARVKRSEVTEIPIEPVSVPLNRLIVPCGYVRHPLGNTVSVGEEEVKDVDQKRYIQHVAFLPFKYGEVQEEDIVGVVDFIPIESA